MVFLAFGPDGWVPYYWRIRDFGGDFTVGDCDGESFVVAGGVESGFDDVFVVRGLLLSDVSIGTF